jgi:signal transduction histidine kinase
MHPLRSLWPRSLAARLIVPLVGALVIAQGGLAWVLRHQQDAIVAQMVHGQAVAQTVTLARLVARSPAEDGERIAAAFGSRQACAEVAPARPADRPMTVGEQTLADLLKVMLHGVEAGSASVSITPLAPSAHPCGDRPIPNGDEPSFGSADLKARGKAPSHTAAVSMAVPLADGRTVTMRMAVDVPGWTKPEALSLLASILAVAAVVAVAVRRQTRSLRALASASDRFGRGEAVEHLPLEGPAEVTAATSAFNTMLERLDRFMRDRIKLLAAVSHDLRTPLTTLRLKAEFIEDELVREDVVRTIDELTVICEATLAFTRAEATAEPTLRIDLRDLAKDIVDEFRQAGSDVELASGPPSSLPCRPVALKRALRNLVENGVRYGGCARLRLEQREGAVALSIEDDGPGIPPERIEEAFQPFVRLESSRSQDTGGIGLGLAVARGIVRAHGGNLTLANRPEGGLRAEILLPAGP